jgi:hypothetical protein
MASRAVRPPKLIGTPQWLFSWKPNRTPLFPKVLATVVVVVGFAFLMSLKVRLVALEKTAPRRASVIYLQDDAPGRALNLRAREGGPFPSRFRPENWDGLAPLEAAGADIARPPLPPYVPKIRDLSAENQLRPLELAAKGQSFFPTRSLEKVEPPHFAKSKLAPVLYPFSGIAQEMLPRELPPFTAAVDSAMSSASWRFLLRLNPEGSVAECVSLEKGGEVGSAALEKWLQTLQFPAQPDRSSRWISLGIGFINQPADGTDVR